MKTLPSNFKISLLPLSQCKASEVVRRAACSIIYLSHGCLTVDSCFTERSSHFLLQDMTLWRTSIRKLLQNYIDWEGWQHCTSSPAKHSVATRRQITTTSISGHLPPGHFYSSSPVSIEGEAVPAKDKQTFLKHLYTGKTEILAGLLQPKIKHVDHDRNPVSDRLFQHYVTQAKLFENIHRAREQQLNQYRLACSDNLMDYAFQIAVHIEPVIRIICAAGKRKTDDSDVLAIMAGLFVLYDLIASEPL